MSEEIFTLSAWKHKDFLQVFVQNHDCGRGEEELPDHPHNEGRFKQASAAAQSGR